MQHPAEIFLKCIFFFPWYLRRKWTASPHLLFHMSVCVSSLSVKSSFFISVSHINIHNGRNLNISPLIYLSLLLCVSQCLSLCRPYLPLNLSSFSAPNPSPTSHKAISSSALRCIYYRGLAHRRLHKDRVKVTFLRITLSSYPTLPKHSPTLYCLWTCFIMSSYMHIIEACPTQAAWLQWNIWIIYYLQSATLRKVFPTKSQNYSCYLHLWEGRGKQGKKWIDPILYTWPFHQSLTLAFFLSFSFATKPFFFVLWCRFSHAQSYKYLMFLCCFTWPL